MDKNIRETITTTAKRNFDFLKATTRLDDLMAKAIPVARGDRGYLLPVAKLHLDNPGFEAQLAAFAGAEPMVGAAVSAKDLAGLSGEEQAFLLTDRFGGLQALVKLTVADKGAGKEGDAQISQIVAASKADMDGLREGLRALVAWVDENIVPGRMVLAGAVSASAKTVLASVGFAEKAGEWVFGWNTDRLGVDEILTAGPTISARENSYVLDAGRYGWNSEWAKYIKKFEESFANYIGVKHALTTSSCTGALHIALKALEIGPGDEVIVPEITWVATASAVKYVGATPVFADVERGNWCLDPAKLEKYITPKTKCIMPVHTYGHPCDMDKIMEIARKHNLYVVEDAAPAIGAECRGRKVGSYGHFAAYSFQGAKMLVTGEGGMLVCNDPELFQKAYRIWDHGRTPGTFWINEVGYKYKMANILAGLGLGQLERVEEQIRAKRKIANWYWEELKDFDGVQLWRESEWARSIYWMSSLTINPSWGVSRDEFFKGLKARKIDTRPAFPAISQYPMWQTAPQPVAKEIGDWGVNLPSGVCLKEHHVRYVARSIRDVLTEMRKG